MRTLLVVMLAVLPLRAQDSRPLKSVEPRYEQYNEELATDFDVVDASVVITVSASGKPLALYASSVPLPLAIVMALKEYEFRPQGAIPHGRPETEAPTYKVALDIPIRQSKEPARPTEESRAPQNPRSATTDEQPVAPRRVSSGILRGLVIQNPQPEYPEYARLNRIQGAVSFEVVIAEQGYVESLKAHKGPFVLIEAAYEAVKQWQYRPYLLQGNPIRVLTDISVFVN